MTIIAISGKAGHGKDTAAVIIKNELESYGERVLITHYADLLKYICKTFLDWDGTKDLFGRSLLQHVGTEIIRKQKPDYWVLFILDILSFFDGRWKYVIIPDLRFPNEIDRMKKDGYDVIHLQIIRPSIDEDLSDEQKEHISETAINDMKPDYTFFNNGTIGQLRDGLSNWVKETIYERK